MIIIEPLGGLANRMRVIASGIWLKEKLNTGLVVVWNENYELNCPYNALFEQCNVFRVRKKLRKYRYLRTSCQPALSGKVKASIINKIAGVDFCIQEHDFYELVLKNKLDIYEVARAHRVTYIQTSQEFGENSYAYANFKPIRFIKERIDRLTEQFTAFTIGVHIRRTDHMMAIQNSPVGLFIAMMQAELDHEESTNFFLCTDDAGVEKEITAVFGPKIIIYQKERSRQTVRGIQDAVVDLYSLSGTAKIFGSYWSSFTEIAAVLNKAKLEVVRTME